MEELYYWGSSKGYTWKQLLYSVASYIGSRKDDVHWYSYNYTRVNDFFCDYSHNENDGYYTFERKKGDYLFTALYCDINTRQILYKYYYSPDVIVKIFHPKRNRVVDSYGRIIPSCQIKDALRTYKINEEDNPNPRRSRYYWRWYWGSKCRRWHTSRYKGKHGFLGNECRKNSIFKNEQREIFEEYDVRIKYNKSRASDVKHLYTDWDSRDVYGAIKRSWKRTRKEKQWM